MSLKTDVAGAVAAVQAIFPFDNYIGEGVRDGMFAVVAKLRKFLPAFEGKRLLDIGCGPMDNTAILQKMGFRCFGVDDLGDPWHQRDDNAAKIEAYARDVGIEFHRQRPGEYTVPFPPESFDVVTSFAVIEHLHESPRYLLNTMGACARPGGLIVITMPNSVNLRKRLSVLMGRTNLAPVEMVYHCVGPWRGHVREYTLGEAAHICRLSGFEILSASSHDAMDRTRLRPPLRFVYLSLSKMMPSLRTTHLVVCRKPEHWRPVDDDPAAYRKAISRAVPKAIA